MIFTESTESAQEYQADSTGITELLRNNSVISVMPVILLSTNQNWEFDFYKHKKNKFLLCTLFSSCSLGGRSRVGAEIFFLQYHCPKDKASKGIIVYAECKQNDKLFTRGAVWNPLNARKRQEGGNVLRKLAL